MSKNCWERFGCGREPGGAKAMELGVCQAAQAVELDGLNGGQCGGRACFSLGIDHCGSGPGGERVSCLDCSFYREVKREQGVAFVSGAQIIDRRRPAFLDWKMDAAVAMTLAMIMYAADRIWLGALFQ